MKHNALIIKMLFLILLLPFLAFSQETINPKFEKKIESVLDHSIMTISCERLYAQIETPKLYILDAREKGEYETSHLERALWVGYDQFQSKAISSIPKDALVVVYCSIGYRSEKIGEQLKKMGYSNVYNLYGGIFEWSNRAYPLVDKEHLPTTKVHAYDKDWGRWVEKGEKVFK